MDEEKNTFDNDQIVTNDTIEISNNSGNDNNVATASSDVGTGYAANINTGVNINEAVNVNEAAYANEAAYINRATNSIETTNIGGATNMGGTANIGGATNTEDARNFSETQQGTTQINSGAFDMNSFMNANSTASTAGFQNESSFQSQTPIMNQGQPVNMGQQINIPQQTNQSQGISPDQQMNTNQGINPDQQMNQGINPDQQINPNQQMNQNQAIDQYARYAGPNPYWNGNQQYGFIGYAPMGYPNGMQTPPNSPKKPSKAKKIFGAIGIGTIFGLVAALVFVVTVSLYKKYIYTDTSSKQATTSTQLHVSDKTSDDTKLNLDPVSEGDKELSSTVVSESVSTASTDVSKVVEDAMPSIVSIDCTFQTSSMWGTYQSSGAGSGIILQKTETELLIATNSHVISDALTIKVTFNNAKSFDAVLKGKDKVADLAVIAIPLSDIDAETLSAISVAKFGSSDDIKVGQMAIAIGNSLGYGQSVTVGYISAKDREVTVDSKKMILLQTDAAINPGNSGGALLNINGEVIGINSVKYADSSVEGMGFAIPISRAFEILSELSTREVLTDEEKGYLGVYIENVTANNSYNWPVGIYVADLVEGGAAEQGGIFVGDIITAVNGATVTNTTELTDRIQCFRYGTEVTITLQRMNEGVFEELEVKVTLIQNPSITGLDKSDSNNSSNNNSGNNNSGNNKPGKNDSNNSDNNNSDNNSSDDNSSNYFDGVIPDNGSNSDNGYPFDFDPFSYFNY